MRRAAWLVLGVLVSGCFRTVVRTGQPPDRVPDGYDEKWHSGWIERPPRARSALPRGNRRSAYEHRPAPEPAHVRDDDDLLATIGDGRLRATRRTTRAVAQRSRIFAPVLVDRLSAERERVSTASTAAGLLIRGGGFARASPRPASGRPGARPERPEHRALERRRAPVEHT